MFSIESKLLDCVHYNNVKILRRKKTKSNEIYFSEASRTSCDISCFVIVVKSEGGKIH